MPACKERWSCQQLLTLVTIIFPLAEVCRCTQLRLGKSPCFYTCSLEIKNIIANDWYKIRSIMTVEVQSQTCNFRHPTIGHRSKISVGRFGCLNFICIEDMRQQNEYFGLFLILLYHHLIE